MLRESALIFIVFNEIEIAIKVTNINEWVSKHHWQF